MFDILCTLAVIACNPPQPKVEFHTVTAYTLSIEETDDTPTIGAYNEDLEAALAHGESICAANFVPKNTILKIDGFGACRVADRTANKYGNRIDILMKTKLEAIQWGKRYLIVKIYK